MPSDPGTGIEQPGHKPSELTRPAAAKSGEEPGQAAALAEAGYAVEEMEPPSMAAAARTWLDILTSGHPGGMAVHRAVVAAGHEAVRVRAARGGRRSGPGGVHPDVHDPAVAQRAWGQFQEAHPLILAPVFAGIPWQVGKDLTVAGVAEILRGMRMAVAVNALGLPAVALPVGTGASLPQSVQVIGPRYREDLCLDAAAVGDRVGIITPIDPRTGRGWERRSAAPDRRPAVLPPRRPLDDSYREPIPAPSAATSRSRTASWSRSAASRANSSSVSAA